MVARSCRNGAAGRGRLRERQFVQGSTAAKRDRPRAGDAGTALQLAFRRDDGRALHSDLARLHRSEPRRFPADDCTDDLHGRLY